MRRFDDQAGQPHGDPMTRIFMMVFCLFILLTGACGPVSQPASMETTAAYEVPLPTRQDKARFLALLETEAGRSGYHVDAATEDDLKFRSEVSPISFSAAVWKGDDDEENIASAMDNIPGNLGNVWLTFARGSDPDEVRIFRDRLIPKVRQAWPDTASLPIMPNGTIPLPEDLIRTPSGYAVDPDAANKYDPAEG